MKTDIDTPIPYAVNRHVRPYGDRVLVRRDDEAQRRHVGLYSILAPDLVMRRGMRQEYINPDGVTAVDPVGIVYGRILARGTGRMVDDAAYAPGLVACFTPSTGATLLDGDWIVDASEVYFTIDESEILDP